MFRYIGLGEFEYTGSNDINVERMVSKMAEEYNKTRVDSFLVTTDIKPRDSEWNGHADKQKQEERRKLHEAACKREKLLF